MRKRYRPNRRIANWRGVNVNILVYIFRCQLHEEIVRMLRIDELFAECRLARLKKLGIAAIGDRRRLETEHRPQPDLASHQRPRSDGLVPVGGKCLLAAAMA